MSEAGGAGGPLRRQAANVVTLLAIVPLLLAAHPRSAHLLPLALLLADAIDSLDGVVARRLGTQSSFGAQLDRTCDALVHGGLVVLTGARLPGAWGLLAGLPLAAIVLRLTRQSAGHDKGLGSSTNELLRHLYAALLLVELGASPVIVGAVFVAHTVTMSWARPMPHLLRRAARSPAQLALFYAALAAPLLWKPLALVLALALALTWGLSLRPAGRDGG